jgi:hypothetical protein
MEVSMYWERIGGYHYLYKDDEKYPQGKKLGYVYDNSDLGGGVFIMIDDKMDWQKAGSTVEEAKRKVFVMVKLMQ